MSPALSLQTAKTAKLTAALGVLFEVNEYATVLDAMVLLTIAQRPDISPTEVQTALGVPKPRLLKSIYGLENGRSDGLGYMRNRSGVAQSELPPHRNAHHAERQVASERAKLRVGHRARLGFRGDNTDLVAALGLASRQIDHMTKQPADRSPQDMQDLEVRRLRHAQNQRSPTVTTSPGRML